jgi:hypothetical protein
MEVYSMETALATIAPNQELAQVVSKVLLKGDLSDLSDMDRVKYVGALCDSLGLNALFKPFDLIELKDRNGGKRVIVYANKTCSQMLAQKYGVSIFDVQVKEQGDYITVTASARDRSGREDSDIGVVCIKGALSGEDKANLIMKAMTKAKRRVVLSICGLGMLDESEVDSIPGAKLLTGEDLTIKERKPSNLHSWACGFDLAKKVTEKCAEMKRAGYSPDQIKGFLPEGVESRKDLTPEQAEAYIRRMDEHYKPE